MRRMSALVVLVSLLGAQTVGAQRATGGDLPSPTHKTLSTGTPAPPATRDFPTPWRAEPATDVPLPGAPVAPPRARPTPAARTRDAGDDQGVPRITAPSGPSPEAFDPSTWDPHFPPLGQPMPSKERISLRTDPLVFGNFETFDVGEGVVAYVMVGNPVVEGLNFRVKAERIVAWLDSTKPGGGFGLSPLVGDAAASAPAGASGGAGPGPADRSVIPEALIAIYASGSVDLVSGSIAFRASELYLNARTNRALLVEPRFDTVLPMDSKGAPALVPLHVRARMLRLLSAGFAVFERGDVSTSRANDHIGLEVAVLTMEEMAELEAGKPRLLGFHTAGSQRFSARGILGRAEGLPILYVSQASFSEIGELPVRPHVTTGSRSSLGRYVIVGVGRRIPLGTGAYLDWLANVGWYSKRGFAAGGDLDWRQGSDGRGNPRLSGALSTFGVDDGSGQDRDGFVADRGARWKFELENRFEATPSLRVDAELNVFSDRGFNREFFEADARNHKDRETYARLRWLGGGAGATLTMKGHARAFETETLEQPGVALWSESLPLGETTGPLDLAFDLSSAATVTRLARRFDEVLSDRDYEALRADVTERVYAPFDVGDVRISPFVGARWTGYFDRSDGGRDVSRMALEAGARANLELHRDFAMGGGAWRLDGLRHIVDLDVGSYGRTYDGTDPSDVPFFDRVDVEESRSEVFVEVRNRLETRRVVGADRRGNGGERRNATLADLRIRGSFWPEGVGPYGDRGPGVINLWGMAEIAPDRAWIRGESIVGLEGRTVRHSSIGIQWSPEDAVSIAVGARHVQDETLAPWFEVYGKWNEKWGARINGIRDFNSGTGPAFRLSLLRFSDDHLFEFGMKVSDSGRDTGVFLNFQPSIGGEPLVSPFDPRETIDYTP